jgi:hypothetical protein
MNKIKDEREREREMGRENKRKKTLEPGVGVEERFPSVSIHRCQIIPQARLQLIQTSSQN